MALTEKERQDLYLQRLLTHLQSTKEKKFYAIQRIDILLITISGAGIYIVLEILKFLKSSENPMPYDGFVIQTAGVLFILCILVNILSQWSGHRANKFEMNCTEVRLTIEKGDQVDPSTLSTIENKVTLWNQLTTALNICSTIFMFVGVGFLTYFSLSTF